MEKSGHFNRLASELSLEERMRLLERLNSQSHLHNAPLYEESTEPARKLKVKFETLSWYARFFLRVISFITGRPPAKIYEDRIMSSLWKSIEGRAQGFYNFQKDLLLPKFLEMLEYLRDASRFFYNALDSSMNRDRGGLLAFLGSLEMPDLHRLLQTAVDLFSIAAQFPELGEIEIRQKGQRIMEDAFSTITTEQKGVMYLSARSLSCLKQLAAFHFDRIINVFVPNAACQGSTCMSASVRDQLVTLNNILHSMAEPPSVTLLESLFVFVLSERDDPGLDIQAEMRKLLVRAETSLEAIREFNKQVPLTALLRCMLRDITFVPKNTGGGEDWFISYKDHWKSVLDGEFFRFVKTKRRLDLQNALRYFLKGTSIKMLENAGSDSNSEGMQVKGTLCLAFLQTFYDVVFMAEINPIIRPILLDGEFSRRENKDEFTECYNNLIKLEDVIRRFDRKLSPDDDFGLRYSQIKAEMTSLSVKRRKMQIILDEAFETAAAILEQTKDAMRGMIKILGGIINNEGKYGSLSNIQVIGKAPDFAAGLQSCIDLFGQTLKLLDDIDTSEAQK